MNNLKKYFERIEVALKSIEETGTINMSDEGIASEFERFMKETDPDGYAKIKKQTRSLIFMYGELKCNEKLLATAEGIWKILK